MFTYLAKTVLPDGTVIEDPPNFNPKFTNLASVVSVALQYIFPIAGIILLLYLVWGGFSYLTAMGDPKKAEAARNRITYAVLGFFIIFAAWWIVELVKFVFKIK